LVFAGEAIGVERWKERRVFLVELVYRQRSLVIGKGKLRLFEILVAVAFQNVFCTEMYQNEFFYFFKNYF
jgi:hypothetical protein